MTEGRHADEDRPDPIDRTPHLRARVPDHVAEGTFSSGAIVVTGVTEFIIDFLQTVARPHKVAARIIIPHAVMPQFIDALGKNLTIYRDRFGDPPQPPGRSGPATAMGATSVPRELPEPRSGPAQPPAGSIAGGESAGSTSGAISPFGSTDVFPGSSPPPGAAHPSSPGNAGGDSLGAVDMPATADPVLPSPASGAASGGGTGGAGSSSPPRRPTPQEIYDDLKIPDTVLSGAYANGVMIGHGASEFGLDFLTSFYPQSAVSARVFMAAGQIPRLLESLQHAMRQLHQRGPSPGQPPRPSPESRPGPEGPQPGSED